MIHSQIKPIFGTPLNRSHWASQGLVLHYLMNEFAGDLVHDSCGMNDGKMILMAPMSGISGWVPGPHGGALAFDGTNDYVDCDSASILNITTGNLSCFIRCFITQFINNDTLFSRGSYSEDSGWSIYIGGGGDARKLSVLFGMSYFPEALAGSVSLNQWMTLGFVKRGINVNLYRDGLSLFSGNFGNIKFSVARLNIFNDSGTVNRNPTGFVSHVSIYNRALSAEEIAYLYAFPWCMYDSGMSAWEYWQQNRNFDHYYRRLMAA